MEEDVNYLTLKTGLRSLLRDPDRILPILDDAIVRTNEIVTQGWLFLKLYMLTRPNVKVDATLTEEVLKTVSVGTDRKASKNGALREELRAFYRSDYAPLIPAGTTPPSRKGLKNMLKYQSQSMVTVFETHVKCHYVSYVNDAVHYGFQSRKHRGTLTPEDYKCFRDFLADVLTVDGSRRKSESHQHENIDFLKAIVLPAGKTSYLKNSIHYDVKVCPQDYVPALARLTGLMEEGWDGKDVKERPRLRNLWPLRTALPPRYVRIDTTALYELLLTAKERTALKGQKIEVLKRELWPRFFRTDAKVFHGKNFGHQIETDGVAVSLLFKLKDSEKKPKRKDGEYDPYLENLPLAQRQALRHRTVVSIDPGKSDLLSCVAETSTVTEPKRLRYTQNQRRRDLGTTKNHRRLEALKAATVVEGKTVTQWETELSTYNHKTVSVPKFREYIRQKLRLNAALQPFYQQYRFRKARFNTYIATQKSEQCFINSFQKTFGPPDKVLVAYGDWSERKHRKFHEPVKGIGFRKLFRRHGFEVALVDEFRSSKQCSHCCHDDARCGYFYRRLDPNQKKPLAARRIRDVHGLLVCNGCSRLWNRDVNAPLNLNRIARAALEGQPRPVYLQRGRSWRPVPTFQCRLSTAPGIAYFSGTVKNTG